MLFLGFDDSDHAALATLLLHLFDGLGVHFQLDVDLLLIADVRLDPVLPDVLVHLKVLEFAWVVVDDDALKREREVRLGQPDTAGPSGFGQKRNGILRAHFLLIVRGSLVLSRFFGLVDLQLEFLVRRDGSARLGCFGRISPPVVDEVFLGLLDLVVGEDGQVVDDRVVADARFNLNQLVLVRSFVGLLIDQVLLSPPLLSPELAVFVFRHRLVSLPVLGRRSKGRRVLLLDGQVALGDGVHVYEFILEDIHQGIAESGNNIGLVGIFILISRFPTSGNRDSKTSRIPKFSKHGLRT